MEREAKADEGNNNGRHDRDPNDAQAPPTLAGLLEEELCSLFVRRGGLFQQQRHAMILLPVQASRESLDDPNDFISAIALGAAVVDEISNPVNDRTSLG